MLRLDTYFAQKYSIWIHHQGQNCVLNTSALNRVLTIFLFFYFSQGGIAFPRIAFHPFFKFTILVKSQLIYSELLIT